MPKVQPQSTSIINLFLKRIKGFFFNFIKAYYILYCNTIMFDI